MTDEEITERLEEVATSGNIDGSYLRVIRFSDALGLKQGRIEQIGEQQR